MGGFGNIEKRVKRHVLGRPQEFFAATPPGAERLCLEELSVLAPAVEGALLAKGGVSFTGRVHACYAGNLRLRTANRILMRVEAFQATNFRQLEKAVAGIAWELYLRRDAPFEIRVASRHSRLFHTDAIAERFKEGISRRWALANGDLGDTPGDARFAQQFFVRATDDHFTVSIDSSGDLLHKRGLKTQGGRAPLRETLAAAILIVAGYDGEEPLVDPMCGAGTFSLEGAMMADGIPAGWYRDFAFMGWPCFRPSRWGHLRREAEKSMIQRRAPVIFASDRDPRISEDLEKVVCDRGLSGTVQVATGDFFDLLPSHLQGRGSVVRKGLVVINPPYGRRLGTRKKSEALFGEICRKLKKDFKGWKAALIAPSRHVVEKVPFTVVGRRLFHGGLRLPLLTGRIQ